MLLGSGCSWTIKVEEEKGSMVWIDGVAGLKSSDFHKRVLSWGAQRVRVWSKDRDKNMVVLPENLLCCWRLRVPGSTVTMIVRVAYCLAITEILTHAETQEPNSRSSFAYFLAIDCLVSTILVTQEEKGTFLNGKYNNIALCIGFESRERKGRYRQGLASDILVDIRLFG